MHNLYFEKDGYHRGQVEEIDVIEDSETKLDDITLVISTGAEGLIVIENGAAIANSRTVSIVLGATEDAVLMKYSESSTFEGASWKPVKSSLQYTFDSQGEKKLYVKFANANGLESSPYSDTVTIDIFSDGTTLFSPSFSVASVTPPNSTFTLATIALPANATAMMVSTSSMFSGASWEATSAQKQISVPANYSSCGTKTFYLKFKDKDGFESPITSKSAELNCWQTVTRSGAPSARERHSAVWTGSQMIIWGGTTTTSDDLGDGGIYNPSTGTWNLISASGSPTPRWQHKAVWTGSKMIIWGGYNSSGGSLNTGSIYDPENGSWTAISTTNAPNARNRHGMVWTGSKVIVFGGCASENSPFGDGGIYDPSLDTWSSLSMTNGPSARTEPAVVWTGTEMIVWGGMDGSFVRKFDAYAYNPTTNQWRTLTSSPSTENRQYYSYVWDGSNLQIWGGITSAWQNTGSVFNPSSNSWSSASITLSWKPAYQTIVSAGTALIFWGGTEDTKGVNNDGYILNGF
jgi:N-acetylneuraminic acid mutarotase